MEIWKNIKSVYELDVYKLAEELEETKSWLRELIIRRVLSDSTPTEYKAIIDKPSPELNMFINSTKAWITNFPSQAQDFANFQFPLRQAQDIAISAFCKRLQIYL